MEERYTTHYFSQSGASALFDNIENRYLSFQEYMNLEREWKIHCKAVENILL